MLGTIEPRGDADRDLSTHGFDKSKRITPNQNPDGTDNADGRQKNRRVEVGINTCAADGFGWTAANGAATMPSRCEHGDAR